MSRKTRDKRPARKRSPPTKPSRPVPLQRRHALALLCLLAAGFVVSGYLTYVHLRLHADPGWRSACDIDPQLSCDAVVLSSYGSIRGTPLSLLGVWFYLVAIALVVSSLRGSRWGFPRSPAVVLFVGAALATAFSVFLAVISIASLGSLCPLCVFIYAINIAVTATTWHAVRHTTESVAAAVGLERAHWRANRALAVTLSLAALAIFGAGVVIYSSSPGGSSVCGAIAKAAASDRSVELVTFTDLQCPHCRNVAEALRPILHEQRGGIRLIFRHYPLDTACNPHAKRSRHPGSCRLALAAICADAQGKGTEFSDAAFEDGSAGNIERIGASVGLDPNVFQACLASDDASRVLRASIDDAEARDVHSTPTLFLNGTRHRGRLNDTDLRCLANAASWPATAVRP